MAAEDRYLRLFGSGTEGDFAAAESDLIRRRLAWFDANTRLIESLPGDTLERAYRMLLCRLEVSPADAPVVRRTATEIVFHSRNPCSCLEACRKLGLDTRIICRRLFERPTDLLLKRLDGRLSFSRNYEKLRPQSPFCEERITIGAKRYCAPSPAASFATKVL